MEKAEELLSKYKVIVMERNQDKIEDIINQNELLKMYKENINKLDEKIKSNISSSYIRSQIKKQKSTRYILPDEIFTYINKNNLYM